MLRAKQSLELLSHSELMEENLKSELSSQIRQMGSVFDCWYGSPNYILDPEGTSDGSTRCQSDEETLTMRSQFNDQP